MWAVTKVRCMCMTQCFLDLRISPYGLYVALLSVQLSINMMDVQRQSNGSDCGVLAIAIAFELCCHRDPCTVKFGNTVSIRSHLARCLEDCKLTTFSTGIRRCQNKVKFSKQVEIACLCREPKDKQSMVKCKLCKAWFHKHCCRETTQVVVPWTCTSCRK